MGCGASAQDDGKGNTGKVLSLPQAKYQEDTGARKARADSIKANAVDYAWAPADGLPRHVSKLPKHEADEVEKKWHGAQVYDVVSHGAKMGWRWTVDDIGDFFEKLLGDDDPPFEDYYQVYEKGKIPDVASRWQDDAEFARQKLQGTLPTFIKKVTVENPLPSRFPVTEDHVQDFKGWPADATLASMVSDGKLYWVDYGWMDSAYQADKSGLAKERNMCVPMMLFFVNELNLLSPACVKLHQADEYPIITSGGKDFVSNRWRVAKILCNVADGCLHEVSNHLLLTHYAMEVVYICLKHTVAITHPLHELLSAHFWYTLYINQGARDTLTGSPDSAVPSIMAAGYDCMVGLLVKGWEEFSMQSYNLEADFKKRGVEDLPDYFYRDDAPKIQGSIRGYVTNILGEYYKNDEDVKDDDELQAFVKKCIDPEEGNMRGSPFVNGKAETREELITFATYVIWACSGFHAVLNNGQYDYYGFIPNAPGWITIAPESVKEGTDFTLEEVAASLPKKNMALYQLSFIHVLSMPTDQPLGNFSHDPNYFKDQPNCLTHLKNWQADLARLDKEIEERNTKLTEAGKVPYPYLAPKQIACSVAI